MRPPVPPPKSIRRTRRNDSADIRSPFEDASDGEPSRLGEAIPKWQPLIFTCGQRAPDRCCPECLPGLVSVRPGGRTRRSAGPAAIAIGPLDGNAHLQQFVDRLVGMVLESEIVNQRQFFRGQLDYSSTRSLVKELQ